MWNISGIMSSSWPLPPSVYGRCLTPCPLSSLFLHYPHFLPHTHPLTLPPISLKSSFSPSSHPHLSPAPETLTGLVREWRPKVVKWERFVSPPSLLSPHTTPSLPRLARTCGTWSSRRGISSPHSVSFSSTVRSALCCEREKFRTNGLVFTNKLNSVKV